MNTYGVDLMGRRRRRRHSAEFKATAIRDAEHKVIAPVAAKAAQVPEPPPMPPPPFVPLALPASVVDGEIRIELHRAGTTIKIVWPAAAARDCAAWLSDWLR